MAVTGIYGLRYLEVTDPPDIASGTKNLAEDVEAELARIDAALAVPALTAQAATVPTLQTTGSTSYVDLATVGPQVTMTTGSVALVHLSCAIFNSSGVLAAMSVAVSGATTRAAADSSALIIQNASLHRYGISVLLTGLTPGSNVFTAKYRVAGGTGNFQDRHMVVMTW